MIQSLEQVIIYSLMPHNNGDIVQTYRINNEQYSSILDINIDSGIDIRDYKQKIKNEKVMTTADSDRTSLGNENEYMCQIACKHIGITGIHIFDINAPNDFRNISY